MQHRIGHVAVAVVLTVGIGVGAAPPAAGTAAVITGRITAPDGSGVPNARVDIVYTEHVPCGGGQAFAWAYTDGNGYYSLNTYPGSTKAKLRFGGWTGEEWVTEWWSNQPTCSSAGWLDVSGGGTITVNARLSDAGIGGVVTDEDTGAGIKGVQVAAFPVPFPDAPEDWVDDEIQYAETDFQGRYELGPLPPGEWRIRVIHYGTPVTYPQQWHGGSLSPAGAAPVSLSDTSARIIDFELAAGANGVPIDVEFIHGPPFDSAKVCLDLFEAGSGERLGSWVDPDRLLRLPVGDYLFRARVCDPPRRYATAWYGGTAYRKRAEVVEVRSGASKHPEVLVSMAAKCLGEWPTVLGTGGEDDLVGTEGADVIVAGAGDDTVTALGGHDVVCLDGGDDVAFGGAGSDRIAGGSGGDHLLGGSKGDHLDGGRGRDVLEGNGGGDEIDGGPGRDTLSFVDAVRGIVVNLAKGFSKKEGRDSVAGVENVDGSAFGDSLSGDGLGNVLRGFAGNDVLKGHGGDDVLKGHGGEDLLKGGPGHDELSGGSGVDLCLSGEVLKSC